MIESAQPLLAKPQAAGDLKVRDHFLREMLMLPDQQVHVIGHDRARVARVLELLHRVGECVRDELHLGCAELEKRVHQLLLRLNIEGVDVAGRGLDFLSSEV